MESAPARLIELSEALKAHLPVLFSFAVLRWLVWSLTACVCAPCIPTGLTDALSQWRRAVVALGILLVCGFTARNPPAFDVCAGYAHQRGQGVTALFSIVVLIGSNRWLSTGLAVAALKGVADLSSTSVPLAVMAGHAVALTENELLCCLLFTGYTCAHAVACHDPNHAARTHSTVLATLVLCAHMGTKAWLACCCCPFRSLSQRSAARAARHATHSPPASAAATPRAKRRSMLPVLVRRRGGAAASPPHIPPPRPSPRSSGTPSPVRSEGSRA
jgi:hypothetical protein